MITTQPPVSPTLSLDHQQGHRPQQQQLIACWQKVEGQLICQWNRQIAR